MTEKPSPAVPPVDLDAAMKRVLEEQRTFEARADELRPANKTVLFDALAAAGITLVVVTFDGYGDSGQIESIEAKTGDEPVELPPTTITITLADWGSTDATPRTMALADAIERMAYDALEATHDGWEINDGAFGDFTFDVAERSITLDYNERYSSSENHTHQF
ncbi:DUF6878 family protein [Xanthobacter autotrophicus]|uniref:DUF6878 family protein n=1 Tax=Xanthobacter autotrophicus TaxID=280 RepID=UPI00372AB728